MDDKRNCSTCANGSTRYEQPTCTALSVFAANICRAQGFSEWKPRKENEKGDK